MECSTMQRLTILFARKIHVWEACKLRLATQVSKLSTLGCIVEDKREIHCRQIQYKLKAQTEAGMNVFIPPKNYIALCHKLLI